MSAGSRAPAPATVARITGGLYVVSISASLLATALGQIGPGSAPQAYRAFFATCLFPLGCLVHRSGFLPRFLGILLVLDGIGVSIWFLQALPLPGYPAIRDPELVMSIVAELGLGLWLLITGVRLFIKGVRVSDPDACLPGGQRPADPQAAGARA